MNRPTDELDNLLSLADEAMAEGDYEDAVMILRQAGTLAPLRKDIRNRLALALEGTPARTVQKRSTAVVEHPVRPADAEPAFADDTDLAEDYDGAYEPDEVSPEPIAEVARKAFKAAAGTTVKASTATRNLTNLLQNGIQSWKSSLLDQIQPAKAPAPATRQAEPDVMAGATEAGLFMPADELDSFIGAPAERSSVSMYMPPEKEAVLEEEEAPVEAQRVARPATASRKAGRSGSTRKSASRPTDMEDVIAAGIGSLIEVAANTDKKKFVYAGVYLAMAGLFALACFDATRKFPGVQTVPTVRAVATASVGALDLSDGTENPISEARQLVAIGKTDEAIALLKNKMVAGPPRSSVDPIRVELAAQLNGAAEAKLKNNQLKESANLYRDAVGVMPSDSGLSLRLANALYYVATMSNDSAAEKKATLKEAREILESQVSKGNTNVQVYRLLALLHEAEGEPSQAAASWQKVKAMAAADSPEHKEAVSHLK